MSRISHGEQQLIANFMATIGDLTMDQALANAEIDVIAYELPRTTARELGHRIREHFARRPR